ncbi:hypothetical protein Y900_024185 [Mycolicibacterium aromaticivorans JS19b1 = JCM 16368]|uniref:Uncharacterized protein n=1 Tax=Mycolicibacterium aromaticivorans JS19b1 = JCM 16368 TaxID=1440774 RepID=A0A064CQJ8_9MYCO|nr:hypothetical protein [Mycolicibacterium aromaticivorans]KDF01942.1 hypothetical protein Y900_024185 [Mycolicibacterium aromaticivorans JS19b1 = JCM 16368]
MTTITAHHADDDALQDRYEGVPLPAGALSGTPWTEDRDGSIARGFSGTSRVVTPTVRLWIAGDQASDGRVVDRRAYIHIKSEGFDPDALDVAGLRRLAAACTAAADEIDSLGTA